MSRWHVALLVATASLGVFACSDDTAVNDPAAAVMDPVPVAAAPPRVLLYTKETEWFHPSTATATQVMTDRGTARGWTITTTKDSTVFTADSLAKFDVVVFLNSSGMTMDQVQRDAFAAYIAEGHGWVGAHAASHTDYDWSFMHEVVGANFCCHPPVVQANVILQDAADPIVSHLPPTWAHADEWYTYDTRPEANPRVKVLLTMDEQSVRPDYPGPGLPAVLSVGYHAVTWKQQLGATRSFYTGLGHTPETWQDENFIQMMLKAVEWAGGASTVR
jgi:type 1 glutamine amidotransferase